MSEFESPPLGSMIQVKQDFYAPENNQIYSIVLNAWPIRFISLKLDIKCNFMQLSSNTYLCTPLIALEVSNCLQ